MKLNAGRLCLLPALLVALGGCRGDATATLPPTPPEDVAASPPPASEVPEEEETVDVSADADLDTDAEAESVDGGATEAVLEEVDAQALLPSDGVGCAPGTRCIKVSSMGRPQAGGTSVAQCRGKFADFIVPKASIPAGYTGPWFTPSLVEKAPSGVPTAKRPWTSVDPRLEAERLEYLMTLRNYAFASVAAHDFTPSLTSDSDYLDPGAAAPSASLRNQAWYPAPRMLFGPAAGAFGVREASRGMTLERTVQPPEMDSINPFKNYAVSYYDARGGRTFARVWSTAVAGIDNPKLDKTTFSEGAFVFKVLFSAAKPTDFPQDILAGSLTVDILPRDGGGTAASVRLLQVDIAVKDKRAGPTGWYFATYAYDASAAGSSPWRKMVPVGLMWGNDPDVTGPGVGTVDESWINPAAPLYARNHLGVAGRLNGPVDNPSSACMSCHSTAQAPNVAALIPPSSGACAPKAMEWFRNLAGNQAFGRFAVVSGACATSLPAGVNLVAAEYSLQLGSTVARAHPQIGLINPNTDPTFNPCTWDDATSPAMADALDTTFNAQIAGQPVIEPIEIFDVTRQ